MPRQVLATSQVGLAHKKEVVELALFAPGGGALVVAQLLVAQAFKSFAFAARLLKDSLLLVPQFFPAGKFAFCLLPQLAKRCLASQGKAQFRGGCASLQFL